MLLDAPDRSRTVEVNRTQLKLWEWGDPSDPAVICVHGAFDHGRMWDGFAPLLAALGYRVVAPDLRGHGDSGPLSSGEMWFASALDIAMLARELSPPVGIVGHSFGGGQALMAAGVFPELFKWVVNLDGLGPPPEAFIQPDSAVEQATRNLTQNERVLLEPPRAYPSLDDLVERRAGVNVRLPRSWVEHLVEHGSKPVDAGFTWKADPLFRSGMMGDFDEEYLRAEQRLVQCPVLVVTGAEPDTWSDLNDEQLSERLSYIPHSRHDKIDDAGHYVHIEQPQAVLEAIRSFLAEVDT